MFTRVDLTSGQAAAPADQAQSGQPASTALMVVGLLALPVAGLWFAGKLAPGELIRPVNPDLFATAVFVGVLSGLLLVVRIVTRRTSLASRRPPKRLDAIVGALIIPVLISTACLRLGVQATAFIGIPPQPSARASFVITGTGVSRGSHYLRVRLDEAGREFSVHVGYEIYSTARDGDMITLPVETGRFSIQRALVGERLTLADLHHTR